MLCSKTRLSGGKPLALAGLLAVSLIATAQQEVDPTWHDPWATSNKAVTQPAKSPTPSQTPTHERKQTARVISRRSKDPVKANAVGQDAAMFQGCKHSETR